MKRTSYTIDGQEFDGNKTAALKEAQRLANERDDLIEVVCLKMDMVGVWWDEWITHVRPEPSPNAERAEDFREREDRG